VVAAHGLVLARWPARMGLRLACLALMLVLLGVVPTAMYLRTTDPGRRGWLMDGGVLVSAEATRVLEQGRDPYQASYAGVLAGARIDVQGRSAPNPLAHHYPYWPGSLALLLAVDAPLRAAGLHGDPRLLYLLVYCALGLWLGRWSLRQHGHLGLALAVCLNPVLLPAMWQGANDVLLVAGMAVAAVALAERRVVLAGLGLGAALAVKLLVLPMAVLFLVWVGPRSGTAAWSAVVPGGPPPRSWRRPR
jgi:Glycosyltransferase family 87